MNIILFFALGLVTIFYLILPLLQESHWPRHLDDPLTGARRDKKKGIWAIADVDDDFEMGKLTPEDHRLLREHFKADLLAVMKREKQLSAQKTIGAEDDIHPDLKRELMCEVVRICGLKKS